MRNIRRVLRGTAVSGVGVALLVCAAAGCKKERQVPAGPPPLPAMRTDGRGVHPPTEPAMPADHPPTLRSQAEIAADTAPPPGGPAPTAAGTPAEGSIRGSIRVADKLKDKAAPGSTIFLVARTALDSGAPGAILAVQRYTVGAWPQPFELTQANVMIDGMRLSGKVVLTARVDQDGDAMTKQAGDLEGQSGPVTVPAHDVALVLDKVRTEAAGAPSPAGMGGGAPMMPAGHPEMPAGHPEMPAGHPPLPAGHPQ